ncbi:MAG: hypothetical protein IKV54_06685 [Clostridia bacterium]|nr:hypothetical protein [Clostridia bacterium]
MVGLLFYICVYLFGAVSYGLIEILWRGYTHWTMIVTGGFCFLSIYLVNVFLGDVNIFIRALISALIITAAELAVGLLVNVKLGLGVWDYSSLKFNFLGQISLVYSFLWYLLSLPASLICTAVNRSVFRNF